MKDILDAIIIEYAEAREHFPKFHSAHEGYAVLKEEVDELWDEIKKRHHDPDKMREEAIQVAAMALAFIEECCE
jgi:NTP pyrophosphatase (non-canonical NTP hydrolase)